MSDEAREQAFAALRIADDRWEAALLASADAPPDPGFAGRLLAIAEAAEQEAAAFRAADSAEMGWPPILKARDMILSYELRPGGTRRGDPMLWQEFDEAVTALGNALEGVAPSTITRAFTRLADAFHHLADDITRLDTAN
jgi:hypothetical protein